MCFQMPLYPMVDDRNVTPSRYEIADPRVWNRNTNIVARKVYLGDTSTDILPYAAQTRRQDLTGLPPADTCVGDVDVFRDETLDYVARRVWRHAIKVIITRKMGKNG
nr:alpha/beta hydrolase fold domain-containing protein [Alicyclobacillus sp. ALC3]